MIHGTARGARRSGLSFQRVIALSGLDRRECCYEYRGLHMARCSVHAVVLLAVLAVPAWAQKPLDDREHPLVVDSAVITSMAQSPERSGACVKPSRESPSPLDVRFLVDTLTNTLTATSHMRAADATAGIALIAIGTRSQHPRSAALFLGVHALQLGVGRHGPWRTVEILPDVGRGHFAITMRRTIRKAR